MDSAEPFRRPVETARDAREVGALAAGLVEKLYAAILDPNAYDALWNAWSAALNAGVEHPGLIEALTGDSVLARHVDMASQMMERLGRGQPAEAALISAVRADERACLLADGQLRVIAMSDAMAQTFRILPGSNLADGPLDADSLTLLRSAFSAASSRTEPLGLVGAIRLFAEEEARPVLFALSRHEDAQGAPFVMLTRAQTTWTRSLSLAVQQSFGLTGAETDVAARLVAGQDAGAIARARGTTPATVRTQIKTLLRKTDLHSRSDLIRLTASLLHFDPPPRPGLDIRPSPPGRMRELQAPGGRRIVLGEWGAPEGQPVLFVHGMLDGWALPAFWHEGLSRRGLRLIAPARPGYAGTSPPADGAATPLQWQQTAVADLALAARATALTPLPVIAQGLGMAFAAPFALGGGARALLGLAAVLPGLSQTAPGALAPRQGALLRAMASSPPLAHALLRTGVSLIDSGGARRFAEAVYAGAPEDRALLERDDVFARLDEGFRFMIAQGHEAGAADIALLLEQWDAGLAWDSCPVSLLHGSSDRATPGSVVALHRSRWPTIETHLLPVCGQLAGFVHPGIVLDRMSAIAR